MSDRPILFSAPMVRALLAGIKTQTRREIRSARVFATPESKAFTLAGDNLSRALQGASRFRRLDGDGWFWESDAFEWQAPATRTGWMAHIGFAPGDRLWVREAWRAHKGYDALPPREMSRWPVHYEADGAPEPEDELGMNGRLRPGMFLPRWASRLTLTVTDVRVQRLQEISEGDARAEGAYVGKVSGRVADDQVTMVIAGAWFNTARAWYADLWDRINGAGSWDANPWVVAYSFTVARRNIDEAAG